MPPIVVRPNWFPRAFGFPRPDWQRIAVWCAHNVTAEKRDEAYHEITREWLARLRDDLPAGYEIGESAHFQLLGMPKPESVGQTLHFLEKARADAAGILGDLAWRTGVGKHVFLRFGELDDFRRYLSAYFAKDQLERVGGVCIGQGYVHVAWPAAQTARDRAVIAHELFHNLVAHLPLPFWLNEGLAMLLEARMTGQGGHHEDRFLLEDHRRWWTKENLERFWSGEAFLDHNTQMLSYSLSRLMMATLCEKSQPHAFRRFVQTADMANAGESALRETMNLSLNDLLKPILGEGDWTPLETRAPHENCVPQFEFSALFANGLTKKSHADFAAALRCAPRSSIATARCGTYANAGDKEWKLEGAKGPIDRGIWKFS